jgi:murein DD-endopeptidase MepM/ murein hydrolase activator NlpD
MTKGARWRNSDGELHAAADYSVVIGTHVKAVRDGTILDLNDGEPNNPLDNKEHGSGTPGNWILLGIKYKGRKASVLYMHLDKGLLVKRDDPVTEGQHIANSGNSGHTIGAHLHVATMLGHDHLGDNRFDYLDNIASSEGPPRGTASNGVAVYPPSLIFGKPAPGPFEHGLVIIDDLHFGAPSNNSVKRLQTRLNKISLEGGQDLPVTGNYLEMTRDEVKKWQTQKDGQTAGSDAGDGNITPRQARKLFGRRYTVRDHA